MKRKLLAITFVVLGIQLSIAQDAPEYNEAHLEALQKEISNIQNEFSNAYKDVDIIATPTSPFAAFKIGENIGDPLKMYSADICTVTVNIAGLPAVSVPCGYNAQGLPFGLQLIGDKFCEQKVLNTAYAYENAVGGFRSPSL